MARLLVTHGRLYSLLVRLPILALVCLEHGGSTQKLPANPNRYLAVPSKHPLLAYSDPALALQRL
jgi:hypothetical protein